VLDDLIVSVVEGVHELLNLSTLIDLQPIDSNKMADAQFLTQAYLRIVDNLHSTTTPQLAEDDGSM